MRTKADIEKQIREIKKTYRHILTGTLATVDENAPVALMQVATETELRALHWVLEKAYVSQYKPHVAKSQSRQ